MFNPQSVQQQVQRTSRHFASNITVYLDNELLVNEDGHPSFCRVLTVDERNGLAIDQRIEVTSILYSVVLASPNPPDTSLPFSISFDGGITQSPVNFLRYVPKMGYFEILLLGSNTP